MDIFKATNGDIERMKKGLRMMYTDAQLGALYMTLTDSAPIKDMSLKERVARAKAIEEILNLPHKELDMIMPITDLPYPERQFKKRY